jgi:hypothetical protein
VERTEKRPEANLAGCGNQKNNFPDEFVPLAEWGVKKKRIGPLEITKGNLAVPLACLAGFGEAAIIDAGFAWHRVCGIALNGFQIRVVLPGGLDLLSVALQAYNSFLPLLPKGI